MDTEEASTKLNTAMIYRMYHDLRYAMHVVPPIESMEKLGEQYGTFAFNASPIAYVEIWKPLTIEFRRCSGTTKTSLTVPDISVNFGRLAFSERAAEVLRPVLACAGEFLPVSHKDGRAFIFNPLITAEALRAIDASLTTYDAHDNLTHFGFLAEKLANIPLFKTELDSYKGIFCSSQIKALCEQENLTGAYFGTDVSNPIGEPYGETH